MDPASFKRRAMMDLNAIAAENKYVHEIYDKISKEFENSRYKIWPAVKKFIDINIFFTTFLLFIIVSKIYDISASTPPLIIIMNFPFIDIN